MSYTLATVETTPFDFYADYRDGGPAKVVLDGYSTSTSSLCRGLSSASVVDADDGMVTLNVSIINAADPAYGRMAKHELDGTKYPTQRDAERAAYESGITGFFLSDGKSYATAVPA